MSEGTIYMVMSVPWLNYPLTIEALTGEGGGRDYFSLFGNLGRGPRAFGFGNFSLF